MTRGEHQVFDPSLYDSDFYVWTQRQAAVLRAMPRGAGSAALDIDHVAEEIEDLGKRDLREVHSFLARVLQHLVKLHSAPDARDAEHWYAEIVHFQASAKAAFTPGMRRLLDGEKIWTEACRALRPFMRDRQALDLPPNAPISAADLLAEDFDVDAALARVAAAFDRPASPP